MNERAKRVQLTSCVGLDKPFGDIENDLIGDLHLHINHDDCPPHLLDTVREEGVG